MERRILLVDGDPSIREAHTGGIRAQGFWADGVATVREAALLLERDGATVVVLGANLSEDPEIAVSIVRAPSGRSAPAVIAVLPRDDRGTRARVAAAGAALVLDAPLDAAALAAALVTLVRTRALSDELREAQNGRDALRREHGAMLDTLVHDLKNALAVVTANLDWAAEQVADTNPELSDGLADGREGATRMRSLLEDLSIVNKLERSEQPLRRESIRVSDVVRAVVSSRAHDAEVRNISLCTDVDEELAYTGDRDLLERVLDGLVETSIRRAPSSGRVSLSARLADGLEIAVNSSPTIRAPGAEGDDEAALRDPMKAALRLYFCRKAVEAAHGRMESFKPDEASRSLVVKLPLVG